MKNWFRYIFYASLVFLVIALIRADYLVLPRIYHPGKLILSLGILFAGFFLNAYSWTRMLKEGGLAVSGSDGITSAGLSVFAKYIPGKFWVVMGRAEFLANRYQLSRKDLGSYSFDAQFVALWVALLLGTIGMISVKRLDLYGLSVLLLFIFLSLIIFTSFFHRILSLVYFRLTKKELAFHRLTFQKTLRVIGWYLLNWGSWCVSFYFLAGSLSDSELPFHIAFAFGLAGSIGILAVFAPGGLGVREGILTGFLTIAGLDLPLATTIAVASRLWFMTGELFIFFLALILEKRHASSRKAPEKV